MSQWHLYVVVMVPLLLAAILTWSARSDLRGNTWVVTAALLLSMIQGLPQVQQLYFQVVSGDPALQTRAMPFFPAVYLLFGRFMLPSPSLAYAGTFLSLLATDFVSVTSHWLTDPLGHPLSYHFSGIGGAGLVDGLVVLPILAVGIVHYARYGLKRGIAFRWMLGRELQ